MTRDLFNLVRPLMAGLLVFWLLAGPVVVWAAEAEGQGAIRGVLYGSDLKSKLGGARVTAISTGSGKRFVSNVTGENGVYEITGLPAGSYDVAIEASGSVYVTDNLIELTHNQRLALSYSIQPTRPVNRRISGMPEPKGIAAQIHTPEPPPTAVVHHGGTEFWTSSGGIALISLLGIGAAASVANSGGGSHNASPSSP